MSRIPSPYNFVPASNHIHFVEAAISQDHPVKDGVCGSIGIAVTNETPLFIRGTKKSAANDGEHAYRLGDCWAIPGSSLRGMIRSVVEIASFSRLGPINDLRFGFRDLQNRDLYGVHMAAISNKTPTPKVSACWLTKTNVDLNADVTPENEDDVVAAVDVIDFMKVENGLLEPLLQDRSFRLGDRNGAGRRYAALGIRPGELREATFPAHAEKVREHGAKLEGYQTIGEVRRSDPAGRERIKGVIVITGQPSERRPNAPKNHGSGNPKHHDFLFYGAPRLRVSVTRRQFVDFEFIHGADAEKHGQRTTPNPEWKFWQPSFDGGNRVPVFAIFEPSQSGSDRKLRSFGLASMFRLAFEFRTTHALRETQKDVDSPQLDFAESMFGRVPKKRTEEETEIGALKGRVSFDTLVADTGDARNETTTVEAVFGAPKASYYPNYMENGASSDAWGTSVPNGGPVSGHYQTLMDRGAKLRGWKRYRLQAAVGSPALPDKVQEHQIMRFRPLKPATVFTGKIRVHNLRLLELGAILWALDFGGEPGEAARHALGLAKSYGYGRVRIEVRSTQLIANDGRGGDLTSQARAEFVAHMERWAQEKRIPGGWRKSLHVENLLQIARPVSGNPAELAYPTLRPNLFTAAKKPENRWTLAPALSFDDWARARQAEGVVLPAMPARGSGSGAGVGGGAPQPVRSQQGGFAGRPVTPPPPPTRIALPTPTGDTAEGCATLIIRASAKGRQYTLVRDWIKEAGPLESVRKAGALKGLGAINDKFRAKYPDIVEWLVRPEN